MGFWTGFQGYQRDSLQEIRESTFETYENGKPTKRTQLLFSTRNQESPFKTGTEKPKLTQTSVFMDRFFRKMSFMAIAKKNGTAIKTVKNEWENAKRRLLTVIKRMDNEEGAWQITARTSVRMTKGVQAFLLYSLFNLTVAEIGRLLGVSKNVASNDIQRVRDLIITDELKLLEYTSEDREKAVYRLEKTRCYSRQRMRDEKKRINTR